jgi:hypothetical protein
MLRADIRALAKPDGSFFLDADDIVSAKVVARALGCPEVLERLDGVQIGDHSEVSSEAVTIVLAALERLGEETPAKPFSLYTSINQGFGGDKALELRFIAAQTRLIEKNALLAVTLPRQDSHGHLYEDEFRPALGRLLDAIRKTDMLSSLCWIGGAPYHDPCVQPCASDETTAWLDRELSAALEANTSLTELDFYGVPDRFTRCLARNRGMDKMNAMVADGGADGRALGHCPLSLAKQMVAAKFHLPTVSGPFNELPARNCRASYHVWLCAHWMDLMSLPSRLRR